MNLCTFLELAMDRSKTAQDEPAIHRHCHNFRPLNHNTIPPLRHSHSPLRHSAILPFRHSVIPLPFCHSAIQLPFNHSAIPPFRHSAIPPCRHSAIPLPFRHSAILQKSTLHKIMDDASTSKRKAQTGAAENGATSKKKKKYKWPCQWDNCQKWSQTGCRGMCKAHYKECQLSQRNNDTEEGAEDLAAFSDAVRVAARGSRGGRETLTSTVGIEVTPPNINNNVCDERTICNNVPRISHQHIINSAPGAVERESAQRAVAREERGENTSQHNKLWRERNLVFENTSQHNERWRERNLVFENTSQHNEPWRERNQVFENTSQHNERWQERNQVFKNTSQHNERWRERNQMFSMVSRQTLPHPNHTLQLSKIGTASLRLRIKIFRCGLQLWSRR